MSSNNYNKKYRLWRGKYFHFENTASPSVQNLICFLQQIGWRRTRFASRARCSDASLDFHREAMRQLEEKHRLNDLMQRHQLALMPTTRNIDLSNYGLVLDTLSAQERNQPWILKPALLNNGQGIEIAVNANAVADFFSCGAPFQGPYVMQAYERAPHLLQGPEKGHKYSMRYFMVYSTIFGAFLFKEGYANIVLQPYEQDNYADLRAHLSNEHLSETQLNVLQRPIAELALLQKFFPEVERYCRSLTSALQKEYPDAFQGHSHRFALLGVDFMVDAKERLWLLEVNHGPCFPVNPAHPLYHNVYTPFWKALVKTLFASNSAKISHDFISL